MNTAVAEKQTAAEQQQPRPMDTFRQQLEQRLAGFAEALPPHISAQRFKSVVNWAVMADPGLLAADRVSLFEACLAAANDGLLPDKRQGALVIYNSKIKENGKEFWIKKVQWMPMIRGIFDKLYQTGQVKIAKTAIVFGGDRFRTWTDDSGDHIEYEEGEEQDRDYIRSAFALVVMKDGGVFVETMKPGDVEKIRSKSKAAESGPWVDWWEEMARKSVFRRLAKRLPMARDLDAVTGRDEAFDTFADDRQLVDHQRRSLTPPRPPSAMLGAPIARPVEMVQTRAAEREAVKETVDPETGEVTETKAKAEPKKPPKPKAEKKESADPISSIAAGSADSGAATSATAAAGAASNPSATAAPAVEEDPRREAIALVLKIAADKRTPQAERAKEIRELLADSGYTTDLASDFVTALSETAHKLIREEIGVDAARAALEA